jgi:hypothetical protein
MGTLLSSHFSWSHFSWRWNIPGGRDRRLATQWEFQSRCTWSHSINDGSVGGGEATGPENVSCLHCDKGPSIFDVRHNVTVNAVVPYSASYNALLTRYSLDCILGNLQSDCDF